MVATTSFAFVGNIFAMFVGRVSRGGHQMSVMIIWQSPMAELLRMTMMNEHNARIIYYTLHSVGHTIGPVVM
jgi:hypothetical protein